MIDKKDPIYNNAVKLIIPENCLVLWNSKTLHTNTSMLGKEKKFDRLTAYITFCPRIRQSAIIKMETTAYFLILVSETEETKPAFPIKVNSTGN